ncbi:hypothetical protein Plhal710r2_c010g0048171 [Plasmopara halstedii]
MTGLRFNMSTTEHPPTDGRPERTSRVLEEILQFLRGETVVLLLIDTSRKKPTRFSCSTSMGFDTPPGDMDASNM